MLYIYGIAVDKLCSTDVDLQQCHMMSPGHHWCLFLCMVQPATMEACLCTKHWFLDGCGSSSWLMVSIMQAALSFLSTVFIHITVPTGIYLLIHYNMVRRIMDFVIKLFMVCFYITGVLLCLLLYDITHGSYMYDIILKINLSKE